MDAEEDLPPWRPAQVARRRKRSLERWELPSKKRPTFRETKATKAAPSTQPVTNSAKSGQGFEKEPKQSIPPRRHTKPVSHSSEGLKSVPRMEELHPKLRQMIGPGSGLRNNLDSKPRQAPQSYQMSPEAPERSVTVISMRDRILQNAQESLMKMIDEGDSELVIANQVDVVEKLRSRTKEGGSSRVIGGPAAATRNRDDKEDRSKQPLQKTRELLRTATRGLFTSSFDTTDVFTVASSPEPQLESQSDSDSNSPVQNRRKHKSNAQKRARKDAQNPYVAATIRTAFPADKPTSLPHGYRTRKTLSPSAIFKESKVHSTFDKTKTNQIDRHMRKINTTNAAAMEKARAARNVEDRIGLGGLTDSDEVTPQDANNGSNSGNGKEGDPQARPDASDKDVFVDFDVMDEEADLLSDDDSVVSRDPPPSEQ